MSNIQQMNLIGFYYHGYVPLHIVSSNGLTVARSKRGRVFPMVILPAFRMEQYRVSHHPYHAPQFRIRSMQFYGIFAH